MKTKTLLKMDQLEIEGDKVEAEHYSSYAGDFYFEDGQPFRDRWGGVYVAINSRKKAGRWVLWELNKSYTYIGQHGWIVGQMTGYLIEGEHVYFGEWKIGKVNKRVTPVEKWDSSHVDILRKLPPNKPDFIPTFGPVLAEREVSDFYPCGIECIKYELDY